ncbi:MAG: glycine--tRNA ligase subunit beta [Alphaproteobacteria bacterium]|nr:glycine--tRNA ligase subunit beta [Alphaproteobacteria bacterium]
MPDLLLELFSEEIPARMQAQAAKDLERLVVGALSDRGLLFEGAKSFAGPRRLTLAITGLPAKQPDVSEELKGPKVDAAQAALDGFLRKTGLAKEQLKIEKTPKGDVYIGVIARKGRATAEVLAEILPETFAKLPWRKSMRWPQKVPPRPFGVGPYGKGPFGTHAPVRWVRPLHGIVCTFDGEVVPFEFAGVTSGNITYGHRFLSQGPIEVRRFEDYQEKLRHAHVILDPEQRKEIILHDARNKAFAQRLAVVEDAGLIEEVVGLAEWPVVQIGSIEDAFMELPPEILQTSMRTHQKYFATKPLGAPLKRGAPQGDGGRHAEARAAGEPRSIANRFVVVANMAAEDGGKEIVAGNERVLRARLSDAKFFWDQDRKRTLESRVDDLKNIVFHAKLGTQYERVERIEALAGEIAEKIGADVIKAKRAARLCKADLTTGVVGEFPELQGVMGRYCALHDGEDPDVADAIRDHYKPLGPHDAVPTNKVSIAVALADKLDQLVGFFAIGEKPTGSGDPYALRRAALGSIRIVLGERLRLPLSVLLARPFLLTTMNVAAETATTKIAGAAAALNEIDLEGTAGRVVETALDNLISDEAVAKVRIASERELKQLVEFFADRLKVALREKGTRHDLIDAVFSLGNEDDLVRLVARVEALQAFLKTDDGANLLVAYRRAANILRDEEKRDKTSYDGDPDPELLSAPEEKTLFVELATASELIRAEVGRERFVEAMGVMARLRAPVDAFFDKVTVNDKNPELRKNRLKLLSRLRATLHLVADFSKIEG